MDAAYEMLETEGLWGARCLRFKALGSTNRWAIDHSDVLRHGDVILALHQTRGRGRHGRDWFSPEVGALTFTVLLKDDAARWMDPMLDQAAALAVRQNLSAYGPGARVKWPNDVILGTKKTAGILLETRDHGKVVAMGIGVNVNIAQDEFRGAGLEKRATSIAEAAGRLIDTDRLLTELLHLLEIRLAAFVEEGPGLLLEEWHKHDFLVDRSVEVVCGSERVRGSYGGLDEKGRIFILEPDGARRYFSTGDVRRLQVDVENFK